MARDWYINGPLMVFVKGNATTTIGTIQQLGLTQSPVRVRHNLRHTDLTVDAWGGEIPVEVQCKLQEVYIDMDLVHVDISILEVCIAESIGGMGATSTGLLPVAGARLGNNSARLGASWRYIGLNLSAPVNGLPWRFLNCYIVGQPLEFPLGTERSVFSVTWRCIPYIADPYNAGAYSLAYPLYDHTLDV